MRFEAIAHDKHHFAGRGGTGAVMGSKNLKAISARGTKQAKALSINSDSAFLTVVREFIKKDVRENPDNEMMKTGTSDVGDRTTVIILFNNRTCYIISYVSADVQELVLSIPVLDKDKWPIERQCKFAAEVYDTFFFGLGVVALKHEGPQVLGSVWRIMLRKHQRKYFLQGLQKLGIDKETPAVACAKYHYLSNVLGGNAMEYVEESPKKAWIRYVSSWWGPGVAEFVIPVECDKAVFESWHGVNWESLKCPKLAFVLTKFCSAGDPYYEGYFEEFDRDLCPEERFQYRPGLIGPEFDPTKAPRLDSNEWPAIRLVKARRNYPRDYVASTIRALLEGVGTTRAAAVVEDTYRQAGIHFGKHWFDEFELPDKGARSIATFFKLYGELLGENVLITKLNDKKFALKQTGSKVFPDFDVPSQIFQSMSAFHDSAAKALNQRVGVTFSVDGRNKVLEWTIEEFDRRLI